ncbi:Ger(x)C family spore germination protein [Cohnella pontilimi]|uniref:Ger(X)C family spore germination protein n=1 Tax=Cohnella pontilimi TaxID=2564100 RepID=A0A4U0F9L0_9BACL|nr:Ger(x)C family spore germination protein [Cohnella pontilimi]TJY41290.1 Ger(x)C family spore germination protein [Cohnella pontilimi]
MNGFAKCLLILLIVPVLTSCWNRRELNVLGIAIAIGIDKSDGEYKLSAQIVNPGEISGKPGTGGGSAPIVTHHATGKTIFEAIRKLTTEEPRRVFAGQTRILVFGEEFAREGIAEAMDIVTREPEVSANIYMLVSRGTTAENILKVLTSIEKVPALSILNSMKASEKYWGSIKLVKLDDLLDTLMTEGMQPALPAIEIKGDPIAGQALDHTDQSDLASVLHFTGMAVFKEDKLAGWLEEDESRAYRFVTEKVKNSVVQIPCSTEGVTSLEMIWTKNKIRGYIKRGKPYVSIQIRGEANVGETQCRESLKKPETMKELQKRTNDSLRRVIEKTILTVQEQYGSDIFGFGAEIHRSDPKGWKKLEEHTWIKEFGNLDFETHVDIRIRHTGMIVDPVEESTRRTPR